MEKAYNKYTFVNNQEPALSAQTLNDISNAIDTIDNRVVAMGDIQGAAQEALMQAQLANAQTYENSRIAADSAEKAMSTTPSGYNQKMVQLNNLRNAPAYSSTKAYAVGDVVDYNDSIYKCKLACTNIKPTNTTYWEEVNVKTIEDDITRLNVDFTDTPKWTNLSIVGGTPITAYGTNEYTKCGNRVHIHLSLNGVSTVYTSPTKVANLPQGYRPKGITFGCGVGGDYSKNSTVAINSAGDILAWSQDGYVGADLSFFV